MDDKEKCRSGKSHKITRLGILHASSNQTVEIDKNGQQYIHILIH